MSFVPTLDLLEALKTKIAAIDHPTISGQKLFEKVEFYANERLADALTDLIITENSVCLLVPGGDDFENGPFDQYGLILSRQFTAVDVLVADRDWLKGQDANFGGAENVGVIKMKDIVRAALIAVPVGIPGVSLVPTGGNQITLANDEVKDTPGRECYVLQFLASCGEQLIPTG